MSFKLVLLVNNSAVSFIYSVYTPAFIKPSIYKQYSTVLSMSAEILLDYFFRCIFYCSCLWVSMFQSNFLQISDGGSYSDSDSISAVGRRGEYHVAGDKIKFMAGRLRFRRSLGFHTAPLCPQTVHNRLLSLSNHSSWIRGRSTLGISMCFQQNRGTVWGSLRTSLRTTTKYSRQCTKRIKWLTNWK